MPRSAVGARAGITAHRRAGHAARAVAGHVACRAAAAGADAVLARVAEGTAAGAAAHGIVGHAADVVAEEVADGAGPAEDGGRGERRGDGGQGGHWGAVQRAGDQLSGEDGDGKKKKMGHDASAVEETHLEIGDVVKGGKVTDGRSCRFAVTVSWSVLAFGLKECASRLQEVRGRICEVAF